MSSLSIIKKIKLSERDKRTIIKHMNICTDLHGKGCSDLQKNAKNMKLN